MTYSASMNLAALFVDSDETEDARNVRETYASGLNTGAREPTVAPVVTITGGKTCTGIGPCEACIEAGAARRLAVKVAKLGREVRA